MKVGRERPLATTGLVAESFLDSVAYPATLARYAARSGETRGFPAPASAAGPRELRVPLSANLRVDGRRGEIEEVGELYPLDRLPAPEGRLEAARAGRLGLSPNSWGRYRRSTAWHLDVALMCIAPIGVRMAGKECTWARSTSTRHTFCTSDCAMGWSSGRSPRLQSWWLPVKWWSTGPLLPPIRWREDECLGEFLGEGVTSDLRRALLNSASSISSRPRGYCSRSGMTPRSTSRPNSGGRRTGA